MASSVWKGTLTFGLLAIPINLFTAARSQRVNLHQLHKVCHTRLKQPLFCPHCNRQVERSEVVKGYEYEKGQYVIVTDEDLKKITPRSSTVMELVAFVKQDQIDPIYFDASYFMLPDKEAEKPYALLLKTLEDSERVGIATVTMHQREYTVFIRPRKNGLTVHTMYYQNEIREVAGYGRAEKDVKLKPAEIKLAEQLVESLAADFKPQRFHDKFQDNLKALIEGVMTQARSVLSYSNCSAPAKPNGPDAPDVRFSYFPFPRPLEAAIPNGNCSPSIAAGGVPPLNTFSSVFCAFSNLRSASP
jgi:DNA end-binding protein Ku